MHRAWIRILLATIVLASLVAPIVTRAQGASSSPALDDVPATRSTDRGLRELRVTHDGLTRTVLLHVPPQATDGRPLPLVVALHGGGGHAAFMAGEHYGLRRKADSAGFLVAFPNGFSRFPGERLATWNAGGCCAAARDRGIDDVGFMRAVVATVRAQASVDGGRIFATGMSNGAMMSLRLACEAPDLFRAVAAVAGTDATSRCEPARPVSVLLIHALDDTHVLYGGGAGPDAFRDRAQVMDFVSVPATTDRWLARNRCTDQATRLPTQPGAVCERWSECAGGAQVQLCVTDTGGHSWPGAAVVRRGKAPASQALDANDTIWRFFERSTAR